MFQQPRMQPQTLTVQNALKRIDKDEAWEKDMVTMVFFLRVDLQNGDSRVTSDIVMVFRSFHSSW